MRTALWLALLGNLVLAAGGTATIAMLRGDALLVAVILALIHALLAGAALRAGDGLDAAALASLELARGGMLVVLLAGVAAHHWPLLAAATMGAGTDEPMSLPGATLLALAGALLSVWAATVSARAGSPDAREAGTAVSDQLAAQLTAEWRLLALVLLLPAACFAAAWHLHRAGAEAWAGTAIAGSLLLPWLALLPIPWRALSRWPAPQDRVRVPRRLRTDAEQVVAEVLRELPLAGHHLRVRLHDGRPYVHLVGVVDDATDLDAERQDVLRARLYERLRGTYPELALDVQFTRDPVWAARGLCGLEQAAA
jgi:hypothetical protein